MAGVSFIADNALHVYLTLSHNHTKTYKKSMELRTGKIV